MSKSKDDKSQAIVISNVDKEKASKLVDTIKNTADSNERQQKVWDILNS